MNQGRLLGIILLVIGFGIAVLAGLFLAASDSLSAGAAVLGAGLAFVVVAPLMGFGLFFYTRGSQEVEQESTMQQQRQLLDILRSRGQMRVDDMALEMSIPVDAVHDLIYQLVGLQVFSGYVNWKEGMLYSADAAQLREMKQCQRCGGDIQLVGRGTVVCPYCGTEYFLP